MRPYVDLFKDGDRMAVSTNCSNEQEFHDYFCQALAEVIGEYAGDEEFQFSHWLRQYFEIMCALRGYKADVAEHRTISAGWTDPPASALIVRPGTKTTLLDAKA